MRHKITYITSDDKEFDNQFEAKKHECELTSHKWDFYNSSLGIQSEETEDTKMKFCKNCSKQIMLK